MKRIVAFLLAILLIFGTCGLAFMEQPATPTDLYDVEYIEIADDDFGYVPQPEPHVYIEMSPDMVYMYDTVTLTAILVDVPEDHQFEWQYSPDDCQTWITIEGACEQTYSYTISPENLGFYWRVCVHYEG